MRSFNDLEPTERREVARLYRKARKAITGNAVDTGSPYLVMETASQALRAAIVRVCFDDAVADGLARLVIVPDDSPDLSWLEQDHVTETYRQSIIDKANNAGCWGIIGQYRLDNPDDEYVESPVRMESRAAHRSDWESVDSCYSFIGDDWKDSGTDIDIMEQTLEALDNALDDAASLVAGAMDTDSLAGPATGLED